MPEDAPRRDERDRDRDLPQDMMREQVKEYYGQTLETSGDLQTTACQTSAAPSPRLRKLLGNLHEETQARYFGCGLLAPEEIEAARVLDLGCGAGRDVYVLAQMAGPDGMVVGVDMTDAQLAVAEKHKAWHMARFGYARDTVRFLKGYLESLEALPLAPGGFDVAVSNCVINLVTDKAATLRGVRRLLSPGGEFYFADVYADQELPEAVRSDPLLYGECLGGALHWRRFLTLAREAGFAAPRLVSADPIAPTSEAVAERLGGARFVSATYRLFAADVGDLARREGWSARYRGGIEGAEKRFAFDSAHVFERGEMLDVDGETAAVLSQSRFAPFFDFAPSEAPPPPAPELSPFELAAAGAGGGGGCCG